MAKNYKVHIHTGKAENNKVIDVQQYAGDKGQPVRIKAQAGAKYVLEEIGRDKAPAPDRVLARRHGKHLEIIFENGSQPDLIIEDYYGEMPAGYNGLIGQAENGSFYEYIPEDPTREGFVPDLVDGTSPSHLALGGEEVSAAGAAVGVFAISPLWGAVGAGGAAAAGGGGGGGGTKVTATALSVDAVTADNTVDASEVAGNIAITGKVSGGYAAGDTVTHVLTLSGTATVAQYQAALRSVTYDTLSEDPTGSASPATRTLSWQVDDGQSANHASNVASSTVTVQPKNDTPVMRDFITMAIEDTPLTAQISSLFAGKISDPDAYDSFKGITIQWVQSPPAGTVLEWSSDGSTNWTAFPSSIMGANDPQHSLFLLSSAYVRMTPAANSNAGFNIMVRVADSTMPSTVLDTISGQTVALTNGVRLNAWTYASTGTFDDTKALGQPSSWSFGITPVNDAPVLANAIADTTGTATVAFSYTVAANAFTDVDSTLSYSATLADGSALPSWLSFNASTRTFSGTPTSAGTPPMPITSTVCMQTPIPGLTTTLTAQRCRRAAR